MENEYVFEYNQKSILNRVDEDKNDYKLFDQESTQVYFLIIGFTKKIV
jgi:hypothetical protein